MLQRIVWIDAGTAQQASGRSPLCAEMPGPFVTKMGHLLRLWQKQELERQVWAKSGSLMVAFAFVLFYTWGCLSGLLRRNTKNPHSAVGAAELQTYCLAPGQTSGLKTKAALVVGSRQLCGQAAAVSSSSGLCVPASWGMCAGAGPVWCG